MDQSFICDKPRGYVRTTTGQIDTALLLNSLVFSKSGGVVNTLPGIPKGTLMLIIQPEVQAIRMRDDGTAPTSSIGYPLAVGVEFRYYGGLPALQVISQVAGAILNIWAFE